MDTLYRILTSIWRLFLISKDLFPHFRIISQKVTKDQPSYYAEDRESSYHASDGFSSFNFSGFFGFFFFIGYRPEFGQGFISGDEMRIFIASFNFY